MQILPISNSVSRKSNVNFDGTMHKSVEKTVKRLEITQIKNLIQEYNCKGRTITNDAMYALKTSTMDCLKRLRAYAESLPNNSTLFVEKDNANNSYIRILYKKGKDKLVLKPSYPDIAIDERMWYKDIDYIANLSKKVESFDSTSVIKESIVSRLVDNLVASINNGKFKTLKAVEQKYNSIKKRFPNTEIKSFDVIQDKYEKYINRVKIEKENQKRLPLMYRLFGKI